MKTLFAVLVLIGSIEQASLLRADTTITSGPGRAHLVELFTSEGCSSCPPAEEWLSTLRQSPRLWKDVVPVAFHVNYWDDLGWTDRFASKEFTDRQRTYAAAWHSDNVYTPAFVLDAAEWRARDLAAIAPASGVDAGKLTARISSDGEVQIRFTPAGSGTGKWQAHAALLGLGMASNVGAGENGGRHLVHDFLALALVSDALNGRDATAVFHLPRDKITPGSSALAVWVTQDGSLEPVQAAGGVL